MLCALLLVCSLQVERNVVVSNIDGMSGSGVILETGLVLTNAHLVGDEVYVGDSVAKVLKVDYDIDLALLKVETKPFKKLKFGKVKQGQAVHYVGNPGRHYNVVSKGYVVLLKEGYVLTNTLPIPGMSGGGLYRNGKLVGLNVGYEQYPLVGVHIAVHVGLKAIKTFLEGK